MTAQSAPMGRPRTKDRDLPPRVYRRGERLYYVGADKRWKPLGKDKARALHIYADYECTGCAGTVEDLVQKYLTMCMDDRAQSTRTQYKAYGKVITEEWGSIPCDLLSPPQLARWRDSGIGKGWANGVLSLLRVSYAKGIEWGWCAVNPATAVAFNAMKVRERELADEELPVIRARLPRWGRTWLDISYCTALRPGDVLALRWDQFGESLTNKTRKTKVKQAFEMSDDLRAILEEAKQRPVLGLYVVADDQGRRIALNRLQRAYKTAAVGLEETTPRDVRAKSATDAEAQGLNYQALLGHSDRRMSDRYLKGKRTIQAPTLKRKI